MLDVVILAAGQGSRMKSDLPKVLHPVGGRPMVQHVIDAARAHADRIILVVGHGQDQVRSALAGQDLIFVEQTEQLGTGHALAQALPHLTPGGVTLMLYGDGPLIANADLQSLIESGKNGEYALLTADLPDPTGYGRIIRVNNQPSAIVEQKDATPDQQAITEINTGLLCAPTDSFAKYLPQLSSDNAQSEYYVTDCLAMAVQSGQPTRAVVTSDVESILGANDRIQLAELEAAYQRRERNRLMREGATLIDPARVSIQGKVTTGRDCLIHPDVQFLGEVTLGDRVTLNQGVILKDTQIASDTEIQAYTLMDKATVHSGADIGPFARLRPGAVMEEKSKAGNFVEIKNATLKPGAKANHLTYVGDATVGERANLGAGTITCNYDGANKHHTEIGADAFVGSNSALVAPVSLAAGTTIGAGSTITKDVAQGLALTRAKQTEIPGFKRPTKD